MISIPIIDPNFRRHSIFRLYNDGAVEDGSSLSDGSYKHTHLSFVCCIGACSCFRSRRTTPTTEQHFQWTQIHTLTQSSKRKKWLLRAHPSGRARFRSQVLTLHSMRNKMQTYTPSSYQYHYLVLFAYLYFSVNVLFSVCISLCNFHFLHRHTPLTSNTVTVFLGMRNRFIKNTVWKNRLIRNLDSWEILNYW